MSFETISIQRSLPIVNGFVVVPQALEKNRTMVPYTDLMAALGNNPKYLTTLGAGTGGARLAGGWHGAQQMITFDAVPVSCCDTADESAQTYIPTVRRPNYPQDGVIERVPMYPEGQDRDDICDLCDQVPQWLHVLGGDRGDDCYFNSHFQLISNTDGAIGDCCWLLYVDQSGNQFWIVYNNNTGEYYIKITDANNNTLYGGDVTIDCYPESAGSKYWYNAIVPSDIDCTRGILTISNDATLTLQGQGDCEGAVEVVVYYPT